MIKILKKPSDYTYYYPEQVEVGKKLVFGELNTLAKATGLSACLM